MTEQAIATGEDIIRDWMINCCTTINQYDHAAHMNLISKSVQVYGIEGFDVINYDDWFAQCEQEFSDKTIKEARYEGLKIKHEDSKKIMFLTVETIEATDGTELKHGIEVVLFREEDGQWRVIEERLLNDIDARNEGLPV